MNSKNSNQLFSSKEAWGFILPALLGTTIFILLPIIFSFGLSFFEWDLLSNPQFVGLKNYQSIFSEPNYLKILLNTFIYVAAVSSFGAILPLILAYIIARKFIPAEEFKLITFLPYITPMVVIATVWAWIFEPSGGLINNILRTDLKWLYDENLAMPVLIFISVWKLLGYNTLIYLTGFANINSAIFEAAELDGAKNSTILWKIVTPLLTPTIIFVIIATIISSFQVFDLIYMMTEGGPNGATDVIVYSVYKEGFEYFNAGKSCALGYLLFFIVLICSLLIPKQNKPY